MTKRQADTEVECPILVKSLRLKINDFITKSEASNIHGNNSSMELLDYVGENWEHYRQRLSTFDIKSRLSKPKEVSPVECARHGWRNIGDDFLQCSDCEEVLCVKMPNGEVSNRVYNHCIWNIQRKLIEAHTVVCPWRTNGGLSTTSPYDIAARYKLLVESGQAEVPLESGVVYEETIEKFGVENRFFLQMAIFGWLPAEPTEQSNFVCNLCGRRLVSSVFNEQQPLNPRDQHHSYCPIIDKIFPLWRESLQNVHKLKKKEPLLPTLWNMKSMLKRLFGNADETTLPGMVDGYGELVLREEIENERQLQQKRPLRKSI